MIRKIILVLVLFTAFTIDAQSKKDAPKESWKRHGNVRTLISQYSFSNWVSGGNNSVSITLGLNYDFNYSKGNWTWDNKIIAQYGLSQTKGIGNRKTDDLLDFNLLVGKKTKRNWSYSFFLNIKSQLFDGFNYKKKPKTTTSGLFSPGYLTFGPGMLWKKSSYFKINVAPLSGKLIFVDSKYTLSASAFGVKQGKTFNQQLGFYASLYYKADLIKNVSMENVLKVYSNYLENPRNMNINYQLNIVMTINKYLSTYLRLHTIIDDNASSKIQFKETLGIGVNYSL